MNNADSPLNVTAVYADIFAPFPVGTEVKKKSLKTEKLLRLKMLVESLLIPKNKTRTVYIYERLNWEAGIKKRYYSYTLNPELGEVIGTKEVEVEEEPEKNDNANN